ncbi:MAG: sortase [Clostridium sp.]
MVKSKKDISRICILLGTVCIMISLIIVCNNIYRDYRGKKLSEDRLKTLNEEINIDKSKIKGEGRMPTIEIDGREYIGILKIKELSLELPVQLDWSYEDLEISPCRYTGSVREDSMVIMGHNYNSHFTPIKSLEKGSEIIFIDVEGIEYKYKVTEIEKLHKTKVLDMVTGDWDLTLFTCDYNRTNRVAVRAERIIES